MMTKTTIKPSRLEDVFNLHDLEAAAIEVMERQDSDYYNGGAEDEQTLAANAAAFRLVTLWPRVLVDVQNVSLRCKLPSLGLDCATPIMLAPVAMQRLAHNDGEAAAVRAAGAVGTAYGISQQANMTIEMYVLRDRKAVAELIKRAEAAKCTALVITVDAPALGRRERDLKNRFKMRDGLELANFPSKQAPAVSSVDSTRPKGSPTSVQSSISKRIGNRDAGLQWADLEWLKQMTELPVILKGVLRYDDTKLAVKHGVDAIWVSNHGGRQLDSAPATLSALPEVVAGADGRVPVLFDGGVRRGSDVLKALALGASAVFVGRPIVWGLSLGGQAGVEHMLHLLNEELQTAMALSGVKNLAAITRDLVQIPGEGPPRPFSRL